MNKVSNKEVENTWERYKRKEASLCTLAKEFGITAEGLYQRWVRTFGKNEVKRFTSNLKCFYRRKTRPRYKQITLPCKSKRKSPGYWNLENLKKELQPLIKQLGHFPFQDELLKMGRGDIESAIYRLGDFQKIRQEMGFKPTKHYLNDDQKKIIIQQYKEGIAIKEIMKFFGISNGTIYNILQEYNIQKDRGEKLLPKESKELTPEKAYILGVVGAGDGFISRGDIIGLGATDKDFVDEFAGYVKKVYNIKPSRRIERRRLTWSQQYKCYVYSKNVFKDILSYYGKEENTKEGREIVPPQIMDGNTEIKVSFVRAIFDSQGSISGKILRITKGKNNIRVLNQISSLLFGLGIENNVRFESCTPGKVYLNISKLDGLKSFAKIVSSSIGRKKERLDEILKYERKRKPLGYWDDFDNVETGLMTIIEELGHFPIYRDLMVCGRSDLHGGIRKHGGYIKVRQRMGFS